MSELSLDDLFGRRIVYPSNEARNRFDSLRGIDEQKSRLLKILRLRLDPTSLEKWIKKHHSKAGEMLRYVLERPPLVVLGGDVGSGKTALAESIGDPLAREIDVEVILFPLSLSTRGQGRVGEMTQLLSAAFNKAFDEGSRLAAKAGGKPRGGVLLLIDEADAIAQSREASQMHHEDRAGVNAFIRGIDQIAAAKIPVAVMMCTNRLAALDPAVKRRAADILAFDRPNEVQRRKLLAESLKPLGCTDSHVDAIVRSTGPHRDRKYGYTFSDITQRLLPSIMLDAYPDSPVDPVRAIEIADEMIPTTPFKEEIE